jgi:hypothetical protein
MAEFSEFSSALEQLTEYVNLQIDTTKLYNDALKEAIPGLKENTDAVKDNTEANKDSAVELRKNKKSITDFADGVRKAVSELAKVAEAGIKFGATVGTSATRGVQLELSNRAAIISQIGRVEADRIVSLEQQQAAQQSLTDTFISTREGMQLSAEGTKNFASNLKGGFKSEFQLTGESLRALTVIGASTTDQFDAFRRATGRASLNSTQLANIVNKNSLSFLLYGNSFARAAANAEKMGISLASVQSSQESMVSNLEGTLDTVNQLNMLGAAIDFGSLVTALETKGPDAVLQYLTSAVPPSLFESTSFRALFNQLGISSETILRAGKVGNTADAIEAQMTELGQDTGVAANALTLLGRTTSVYDKVLQGLITTTAGAATSMLAKSAADRLALTGGLATAAGIAGRVGLAATGVGAVISIASLLPLFFGKKGDDVVSTGGYGSRTLVTPKGNIALNNNDTVLAGTQLMSRGSLQTGADSSNLARKVDELITTLNKATTVINVGGTTQVVPRMNVVGVYDRNGR